MKGKNRLYVDVVDEAIMNVDALQREMRGWRRFRIKYGGHAEACPLETVIFLPLGTNVERLERLLNG